MAIQARRKDGTPVQVGDAVVIYIKGSKRVVGRVREICDPFKFHSFKRKVLQTYRVYCDDGVLRPVHAWHIRFVIPKKTWRKPATISNGQAATRLTAAQR